MKQRKKPYQLYLLRCWPEGSGQIVGDTQWRFSLETVGGSQRRYGFSNLADLCKFLANQLDNPPTDVAD